MMFGARVRYGITFKANQPGFQVYSRKYFHNFKVAVTTNNYEGSVGSNLSLMKSYVMAEKTKIGVYDQENFNAT
jgi:aspartate 1-decarboxylase